MNIMTVGLKRSYSYRTITWPIFLPFPPFLSIRFLSVSVLVHRAAGRVEQTTPVPTAHTVDMLTICPSSLIN